MSYIFRPQRHGALQHDIDPFANRHFHGRPIRPSQSEVTFSPEVSRRLRLIGPRKSRIDRLHTRVSDAPTFKGPTQDEIIELQIETTLRKLFKRRKTVYPSDVSSTLGLSYEDVLKVFERMVNQEKLKVVTSKVVRSAK